MRRRGAAIGAAAVFLPLLAFGGSYARTEWLRSGFESQFWADAADPNAELLGARIAMGRLVSAGSGTTDAGDAGAHCDFLAQAVYGTDDRFEQVEARYAGRSIELGATAPVGLDVRPIWEQAIVGEPLSEADLEAPDRELLRVTSVDLPRAATFQTVYLVEALSWGHTAWLDRRCR